MVDVSRLANARCGLQKGTTQLEEALAGIRIGTMSPTQAFLRSRLVLEFARVYCIMLHVEIEILVSMKSI